MQPTIEAIKANLYPTSHAAIGDWDKFPWHRDRYGDIQTHKRESSQALAIDVFGTIKVSGERDRILGTLARQCGLPEEGPWTIRLEWTAPKSLLREPRPTQVDALARGQRALLVIECKFAERGGSCSQPNAIATGAHQGMRQCTGDYALQVNPATSISARCTLSGKGVRYWEMIPAIFGLDPEQDFRPCPFKGETYQWMRNVVLANALASAESIKGAVVAAYADSAAFPTAKEARAGSIGRTATSGRALVIPKSYQSILALAQSTSGSPGAWRELADWVERKIGDVEGRPF